MSKATMVAVVALAAWCGIQQAQIQARHDVDMALADAVLAAAEATQVNASATAAVADSVALVAEDLRMWGQCVRWKTGAKNPEPKPTGGRRRIGTRITPDGVEPVYEGDDVGVSRGAGERQSNRPDPDTVAPNTKISR